MKARPFVAQLREFLADCDHWPLLVASDSDLQDGRDRPRFRILLPRVDEVERAICLFVVRAATPRHEPPHPITLGEFIAHISPLADDNQHFDIVASIDASATRSSRRTRRFDLPVASIVTDPHRRHLCLGVVGFEEFMEVIVGAALPRTVAPPARPA